MEQNLVIDYLRSFIFDDNSHLQDIKASENQRDDVQPSVEKETGKLLGILVRLMKAEKILELGTCLGYSTILLGEAASDTGGSVITVENDSNLYREAQTNIHKAGLSDRVELLLGDAVEELYRLSGPFDFIFQDARKSIYPKLLDRTVELTKPGGLIVADDTLFKVIGSPRNLGEPMDEYNRLVFSHEQLYSTIIPSGDGVTISFKKF